MKKNAGTYVYCVVDARGALPVSKAPRGLPSAGKPRVVDAGPGRKLVVADVPDDAYGAAALKRGVSDLDWVSRCALGHDAVVGWLAARAPVIPMKLFTIFAGDERARADVVKKRARIDRVFARIAGCTEWGVRVAAVAPGAKPGAAVAAAAVTAASGASYLMAKKRARDHAAERARAASERAEDIHRALHELARESRRQPLELAPSAGGRLLLDAAYLVPETGSRSFRAAVARLSRDAESVDCKVALTGPWPPYNFIGDRR